MRTRTPPNSSATLSRLAALLHILETAGIHGWRTALRVTSRTRHTGPAHAGDPVALRHLEAVNRRVDRLIDQYLTRIERREDQIAPHTDDTINIPPLDRRIIEQIRLDRARRCPNCGCDLRVGGTI